MKTQKEITQEVRRIRERIKGFSGYWIGEGAAAIQALEWVTGKRSESPSDDVGKTGGEHEKIAAGLLKSVEKEPAAPAKPASVKASAPAAEKAARAKKNPRAKKK